MWRHGAAAFFLFLAILAAEACGGGGSNNSSTNPPVDAGTDTSVPVNDTPYCSNGQPTVAYPNANLSVTLLGTLPDMTFDGLDASGPRKVSLHDYFEPCAVQSKMIVIRVSAGWCGTCRWHAAHTGELMALDVAPRLEILDLIVAGAQNLPPVQIDLTVWK
ncbi:MAG: hypothetical protein ACREJX_00770, partial [Polyangiaceae bacterium]